MVGSTSLIINSLLSKVIEKRTQLRKVSVSSSEMQSLLKMPLVSASHCALRECPVVITNAGLEAQQQNSSFSPRREDRPSEGGQSRLNLRSDKILI